MSVDLRQFQEMIESLAEAIVVVEPNGVIVATNHAWRRNVADLGLEGLSIGDNYRELCVGLGRENADSAAVVAGIDDVASGREERYRHHYAGTDYTHGHDYEICISAIEIGGRRLLVIASYDVTSERRLRQQCRRLESDLLQIQALERQRIGRDLHDSTAQELVALRFSLIRLKQLQPGPSVLAVLSDIESTLDHMNHEIRAISYLLHPPSLAMAGGLAEALEKMAVGFGRRIALNIIFDSEGVTGRWDPVVESALYRLAQEALANVQRHARASEARIRLVARRTGYLHLVVEDNGVGIRLGMDGDTAVPGVGIAGMKARITELGGRLSIKRCVGGTRVVASLRAYLDEDRGDRDTRRLDERARDRELLSKIRAQGGLEPLEDFAEAFSVVAPERWRRRS